MVGKHCPEINDFLNAAICKNVCKSCNRDGARSDLNLDKVIRKGTRELIAIMTSNEESN